MSERRIFVVWACVLCASCATPQRIASSWPPPILYSNDAEIRKVVNEKFDSAGTERLGTDTDDKQIRDVIAGQFPAKLMAGGFQYTGHTVKAIRWLNRDLAIANVNYGHRQPYSSTSVDGLFVLARLADGSWQLIRTYERSAGRVVQ